MVEYQVLMDDTESYFDDFSEALSFILKKEKAGMILEATVYSGIRATDGVFEARQEVMRYFTLDKENQ